MSTSPRSPARLLVLAKIAAILDAFSLAEPELSLVEIRQSTSLPASTVQRLVGNLVLSGFLDRTSGGYSIGKRLSYWAASAPQSSDVVEAVKPVMMNLRDDTGEAVCLFTSSQTYRVCIAMCETPHLLHTAMRVGRIMPLHVGSAGRVLLAWNQVLMERVIAQGLDPLTNRTITEAEALRENVLQCHRDGYAITVGERESGASGLSAPVFNAQSELEGALTVMGPSLRMSREFCEASVGRLLEAAEAATRLIGGRRPGIRS
ncbi:MAG: IclR family transcriptional regulator [Microbacteriaceae bacterium]